MTTAGVVIPIRVKMSDYLPKDLVAKILLRSLFDSLLQSRCVSKSWCALIDSPSFKKMHLKNSLDTSSSDNIQIIGLHNRNKVFTFNFDFDYNLVWSSVASTKQLNYPIEYDSKHRVHHLVGSCHGLLCLRNSKYEIVLWNSWIQKYWKLPPPTIQHSMLDATIFLLGFGYDQLNDDYKVLNLVTVLKNVFSREESILYQDGIYLSSLKMNSSRRIDNFQSWLPLTRNCVLANGSLRLIVGDMQKNEKCIVVFYLSSEKFQEMPLPRNVDHNFIHYLNTVNGCLCLVSYSYFSGVRSPIDVWVMEDYGVDESWTKLTSLKIPGYLFKFCSIAPLAYSEKSRKMLLQIVGEKLVLYDLETKSVRNVATNCYASCVCVGSLVCPICGSGTNYN